MARRTVVRLIDDIDGGEALTTVQFMLDDVDYEIELNLGHSDFIRQTLERYIAAARVTRKPPGRTLYRRPSNKTVREWANANGYSIHGRGRVPADVLRAYQGRTLAP